ncbi:MAG: hypothetical protein LBH93_00545, partial [Chitinispirillales bacterium]|nr:hypothetical protein [Chitinispirillales bacterium]
MPLKKPVNSLIMSIMALTLASASINAQPPATAGKFTDKRDGKMYKSVKIGGQTWMAENLNHKT